jgi:hypothetical protein
MYVFVQTLFGGGGGMPASYQEGMILQLTLPIGGLLQ